MSTKEKTRRWSVEKRLEFIDFRLFWEGHINRSDIVERFSVSIPQASNDLSQYQQIAPKNLEYDHKKKRYFVSQNFKPAILKPDSENFLWQMRDDVSAMSGIDGAWLPNLPSHDIVRMPRRNISPNILREIVSAVRTQKALEVLYLSMSSEEPAWRVISPHAFAFDGMRWHTRAYCHKGKNYKDFLLPRILKIKESAEKPISGTEDTVWNEIFTVTLKPHPKLSKSQAEVIAQDFSMKDMRLNADVRLALLYYFLRRLGLHDGDGDTGNPKEQHVVVANKVETKKAIARARYEDKK